MTQLQAQTLQDFFHRMSATHVPGRDDWNDRLKAVPTRLNDLGLVRMGYRDDLYTAEDQALMDSIIPIQAELIRAYHGWLDLYEQFNFMYVREVAEKGTTLEQLHLVGQFIYSSAELVLLSDGTNASPSGIDAVVTDTIDLLTRKSGDYGQCWRRHGELGIIVRLFDKIARFTNLMRKEFGAQNFESRVDSARDMVGYAIILFAYLMEQETGQ